MKRWFAVLVGTLVFSGLYGGAEAGDGVARNVHLRCRSGGDLAVQYSDARSGYSLMFTFELNVGKDKLSPGQCRVQNREPPKRRLNPVAAVMYKKQKPTALIAFTFQGGGASPSYFGPQTDRNIKYLLGKTVGTDGEYFDVCTDYRRYEDGLLMVETKRRYHEGFVVLKDGSCDDSKRKTKKK